MFLFLEYVGLGQGKSTSNNFILPFFICICLLGYKRREICITHRRYATY